MGYRSDVAYTIRFVDDHDTNNHQSFFTFLAEAKADPRCALALEQVDIHESRQEINFSAEDVKWYESYVDVISHTALFDQARSWVDQTLQQQLVCTIGAIFMRIGESTDDVEEIAVGDYNWDWMHISRQIVTDWS
jgi:hypothetical protein